MQRLHLLFYLLLPPETLSECLDRHPAGGVPTWFMEVGNDIILSLGSLAHYHYYGDVPLVGGAPASNKKQPKAFKGTQDYLTVSAPEMLAFLQEILTPPSEEPDSARSSKNSATQKEDPDGIVYTGQPSSPMKKSSSSGFLSRRSSNGNKQDSAGCSRTCTSVVR